MPPAVKADGVELGRQAAAAILVLRADDGAQHAEPRMGADYVPGTLPGQWRQDPGEPHPAGDGRALGRGQALRAALGAAVPPAATTGHEQRRVHHRLRRGQAPRRRRHHDADGALFQTLRRFYGTDAIAFTFVSDEFNGVTRDNAGQVRALAPRSFSTLSQAEIENGRSRIYLGIHWDFDCTRGIEQGRAVADFVMRHAFEPAGLPPR